jgi:hypothetical protein
MELLDLNKRFGSLYKPSAKAPALVAVPSMRFLMLDGEGGVGGPDFIDAMQTLYGLAYPIKFAPTEAREISYSIMPAEGLYWSDEHDGTPGVTPAQLDTMTWRLMIMLPEEVPGELVEATRAKVAAKKDLPRLDEVRLQTFSEGSAVQILHLGPYADEAPTAQRLHDFAAEKGFDITGPHHEIYLSDPNRSAPEKLKTILRYGVTKKRVQKSTAAAPVKVAAKSTSKKPASCKTSNKCAAPRNVRKR